MALITISDVEQVSGSEFDDETFSITEALIPGTVAAIEAYLGRAIEVREHVRERVSAPRTQTSLYVRNYPVQSVSAVWVDGIAVPTPYFYAYPYGVRFRSSWFPSSWEISTPIYERAIFEITYVGGLNDARVLAALKNVAIQTILKATAEAKEGDEGRLGYLTMKVEDYSWSKAEAGVSGMAGRSGRAVNAGPFGPAEQIILDRYRLRTVISG